MLREPPSRLLPVFFVYTGLKTNIDAVTSSIAAHAIASEPTGRLSIRQLAIDRRLLEEPRIEPNPSLRQALDQALHLVALFLTALLAAK